MSETKKWAGAPEVKRGFWDGVYESAKAVQAGPPWMRAGITLNEAHFITYAPEQEPNVAKQRSDMVEIKKQKRAVRNLLHMLDTLDESNSLDDLMEIDAIRERCQDVCTKSESLLRVSVRRFELPLAGNLPEWFWKALDKNQETALDGQLLASAEHLVRATIASMGIEVRAHLTILPETNMIEIQWDTPKMLVWVIRRSQLPWPGVNVKAYAWIEEDLPPLESRNFCLAHRVIEHARDHLVSHKG